MRPRIPLWLTLMALLIALGLPMAGRAQTPAPTPASTPAPPPAAEPALLTLDDVRAGSLMLRADAPGRYVAAPLVSTRIEMAVTGPVLRATVTQRFRNPTDRWVEGVYAFPLPEESAVDGLRMRIGDRFIEGDVKERQEAKEIYEAAKDEGKKAALVEQERPNLFTNSVANIGPGDVVVAQITLQQALSPVDGRWELRMPLVAAPRYNPEPVIQQVEFGASGWAVSDPVPDRDRVSAPVADPRTEAPETMRNPVELSVDLAPGFEIADLESPFHRVQVTETAPGRAMIVLAGPVPAERDFVLRWEPALAEPQAALFTERAEGAEHLLLMLTPPDLGDAGPVRPREVIFVQDVSGSMSGASIEQARAGLEMAIERLRAEDLFNLVIFNDRFARFEPSAVPATAANKSLAIAAVRALDADGGTEMFPALDAALEDPNRGDGRLRQLVFLTDRAVGNEAEMLALIGRKLGRSRLFTVGIGSAPNSYFMRRAAEAGRGAHVYIGALDEVAARMTELFAKIETPAITDLELALPEGVAAEIHPNPLPDLYAGAPIALSLKTAEARGTATLSGRRGDRTWQTRLDLAQAAERPGVAKLYARRRIASLEALRLSPDLPADGYEQVDAEILATALDYGLVSRLTSLVAVDVTPSRPADETLATTEVPLNLPAGWDPEAFLFETAPPAPLLDKASFSRIAPQRSPEEQEAAPVLPKGALNWRQSVALGLALLLAGLAILALAGRGARIRGGGA
ncbi:MAG: marine proteobacterial sortase target protein [Paracoccaceae bacterium]